MKRRTKKRRFDKPGTAYFFAPIAGYDGLTNEDVTDGRSRRTIDARLLADRGGRGGRPDANLSEVRSALISRRYDQAFKEYMRAKPGTPEAKEAFWRWVSLPSC